MVQMANQIALFFGARPHEEAVDAVAEHLRSFWEKRMREQLVEYITGARSAGAEG